MAISIRPYQGFRLSAAMAVFASKFIDVEYQLTIFAVSKNDTTTSSK